VQTCNISQVQPPGQWFTAAANGTFHFFNTNRAGPQVLRGVSMTGFETGTRDTESGAGYWLFQAPQESAQNSATIITNIVDVLADDWQVDVVRVPICGSAWLQNYMIEGYGGNVNMLYRDWVDIAICEALSKGLVVLLDVHLWAIADETVKVRPTVAAPRSGRRAVARVRLARDGTHRFATRAFKTAATASRTCQAHRQTGAPTRTGSASTPAPAPARRTTRATPTRTGSAPSVRGECGGACERAVAAAHRPRVAAGAANANGVTLDNLLRYDATTGAQGLEHWLNLWYELAIKYGGASNVWCVAWNAGRRCFRARLAHPHASHLRTSAPPRLAGLRSSTSPSVRARGPARAL